MTYPTPQQRQAAEQRDAARYDTADPRTLEALDGYSEADEMPTPARDLAGLALLGEDVARLLAAIQTAPESHATDADFWTGGPTKSDLLIELKSVIRTALERAERLTA